MGRPPILSGQNCYHCGSKQTSKAGISKGKRRYKCRACVRYFIVDRSESRKSNRRRAYARRHDLPTAGQLILELQSIAQHEVGRTPRVANINRLSKQGRCHSAATYYAVFGSYVAAVRRARLKQHYRQQFDETDRVRMLNELRTLSKNLGRPLIAEDVVAAIARTKGGRHVSPINHYQIAFGSVPNAVAAAGVAPKIQYSRDEMIGILRKLDSRLDRPVQKADLEKLYNEGKGPAPHTLEKRFGGMNKARRAAGIKTDRSRH